MSNSFRKFDRRLSSNLIERLQTEPLFTGQIRPDIMRSPSEQRAGAQRFFPQSAKTVSIFIIGEASYFPTTRPASERTSSLASFINAKELTPEIRESDLTKVVPIRNFSSGYGAIKSLCALYAGDEAKGVSELYGRFGFAVNGARCVVLDIEASFDAHTRDDATEDVQDRIDLVLLNVQSRMLMFVEAKRYVNPEIRAIEGSIPPVVTQVMQYKAQLMVQRQNVLEAYGRYVEGMNKLFSLNLPEPVSVASEVPLLIFGYDGDQEGKVAKCRQDITRNGVRCLSIGKLPPKDGATLIAWFVRADATTA